MSEVGDVVILDADANILKTPFNDLESLPSEVVIYICFYFNIKSTTYAFIVFSSLYYNISFFFQIH